MVTIAILDAEVKTLISLLEKALTEKKPTQSIKKLNEVVEGAKLKLQTVRAEFHNPENKITVAWSLRYADLEWTYATVFTHKWDILNNPKSRLALELFEAENNHYLNEYKQCLDALNKAESIYQTYNKEAELTVKNLKKAIHSQQAELIQWLEKHALLFKNTKRELKEEAKPSGSSIFKKRLMAFKDYQPQLNKNKIHFNLRKKSNMETQNS